MDPEELESCASMAALINAPDLAGADAIVGGAVVFCSDTATSPPPTSAMTPDFWSVADAGVAVSNP